jgi:ligand-binding SRPBCC domain-containing protein
VKWYFVREIIQFILWRSVPLRAVHVFHLRTDKVKNLTNADQWKEGHAMTAADVFERIYMFFPITFVTIAKGLYSGSASPLHSLE